MLRFACLSVLVLAGVVWCDSAFADAPASTRAPSSITDRGLAWPTADQWRRILLLEDYNSRVVVLGTTLLGGAAGLIGSFALLRKRALMGDALAHATLPGIALAFMAATAVGWDGKSISLLLVGATLSGLLGVGTILLVRNLTRLKEDAALGIVLSVFFGAGVSLLGVVQQMETGHAAGLEAFIYGKTASMGSRDAALIGAASLLCTLVCLLLFKEFKLLCFDEGFAGSEGVPVVRLDMVLMALVVVISIVGLQAVGLVLMIALLVIPAAAARFWTERMFPMALIASGLGAAGGLLGSGMSAVFSKLPSGAMIVLVCTAFFLVSLVFGAKRGVLIRGWRRFQLNRSIDRQHLLRAIYELLEDQEAADERSGPPGTVSLHEVLDMRSWSSRRLGRAIRRAEADDYLKPDHSALTLTPAGLDEARRLTRQHRLWELYLLNYADVAPANVDRDADAIEHVLEPGVVAELQTLLLQDEDPVVPASPHAVRTQASSPAPAPARGTGP